jgi:hypothetical protein
MPSANYGVSVAAGGVSVQRSVPRTGSGALGWEETIPVAHAVTSWVKTDANTAACNLATGHGQTDGKFDVYWTEGGVNKLRYGVDGTIATNALSLDGGAGDDFPVNGTTGIVVCKQLSLNTAIDGDALVILAVSLEYADLSSTSRGHVDMQDSGPATIEEIDLLANTPVPYDIYGGVANVFTGNPIVASKVSHNDTTYEATIKICGLVDATP